MADKFNEGPRRHGMRRRFTFKELTLRTKQKITRETTTLRMLLFLAFLALVTSPSLAAVKHEVAYVTGEPAPGIPGAVFRSFGAPSINDLGGLAFSANYTYTDPVSGEQLDGRGIWGPDGQGGSRLVASFGMEAPGMGGARFTGFGSEGQGSYAYSLNDQGDVLIRGVLEGQGSNPSYSEGLWLGRASGTLELVAKWGDEAPGTGGQSWEYFLAGQPHPLGEDGSVAIYGALEGGGQGLWLRKPDRQIDLVVIKGQEVPANEGFNFLSIGETRDWMSAPRAGFNEQDDLVFHSQIVDTNRPDNDRPFIPSKQVFWRVRADGSIEALPPKEGLDWVISRTGTTSWHRLQQQLHVSRDFNALPPGSPLNVFTNGGVLTNGLDAWLTGNGRDWFAYDPGKDQWEAVFEPGSLLEVAPGDTRILRSVRTAQQLNPINQHGQIPLTAYFGDSESAIAVFTIPEPSGIYALTLISNWLILRRHARSS